MSEWRPHRKHHWDQNVPEKWRFLRLILQTSQSIFPASFSRLFVFSAAVHERQTGKLEPPAFVWRNVRCCHQCVKTWPIPVCCDQTGAQVRLLTDDLPDGDTSCSSKVQTRFIIVSLGISAASFLFVWQRADDHHDIIALINMVKNIKECFGVNKVLLSRFKKIITETILGN